MVEFHNLSTLHLRQVQEELIVLALGLAQWSLGTHVDRFVFWVGAIFGGTDVDAQVATRAVLRRYLDGERLALVLIAPVLRGLEGRRRTGERFRVVNLCADCSVRTHERALIALDTDL